ncbi:MAG TPA: GNAT family N-acetyltransferase [Anaerolineales bacterium]|nr:GNAT family N-acetyltransferase [Anaerolineales bacterium]
MNISIATQNEYVQLVELDHHISTEMMKDKIDQGEIIIATENTSVIGWLRYGYFWDSIPFMNMLTVIEEYRGRGIGTQLAIYWEMMLRDRGFNEVLTSTYANERGQFLYRKLGYKDCGALLFPKEPLEIIFHKIIAPQ